MQLLTALLFVSCFCGHAYGHRLLRHTGERQSRRTQSESETETDTTSMTTTYLEILDEVDKTNYQTWYRLNSGSSAASEQILNAHEAPDSTSGEPFKNPTMGDANIHTKGSASAIQNASFSTSTWKITAAAVGAALALVILVGFLWYCRRQRRLDKETKAGDGNETDNDSDDNSSGSWGPHTGEAGEGRNGHAEANEAVEVVQSGDCWTSFTHCDVLPTCT